MRKTNYQRQGRFFYPNYQRTITTNKSRYCGLLIAGFFIFMMVFSAGSVFAKPPTPPKPTISGPSSGLTGIDNKYIATTDPTTYLVSFTFYWGSMYDLETTDFKRVDEAGEENSWSNEGTYDVKVRLRYKDSNGNKSEPSEWSNSKSVKINENPPPNIPELVAWVSAGEAGISYDYIAKATDPDGHDVKFTFNWGDGTQDITPYVGSGENSKTMSHTWSGGGTYNLKVYATDEGKAKSGTCTLEVSMFQVEIPEYPYEDIFTEDVPGIMLQESPVEQFQSPLHMGSISHSIPIYTPSGTGGLRPNIALTYNSLSVDQMGIGQQASVCGLGWSISGVSYIYIKDGRNTIDTDDDTYGLCLGGSFYDLAVDDNDDGLYHTIPETYMKIDKIGSGTYIWKVKTKDGTEYKFGDDRKSKFYYDGDKGYRWNVDTVTDISGNEMYFYYNQTEYNDDYTRSGRIDKIEYTRRSGAAVGSLRTVDFSYTSSRTDEYDWNKEEGVYGIFYEEKELNKITVKIGGSTIKKYDFGYDYSCHYATQKDESDNYIYPDQIYNGNFEDGGNPYIFMGWKEATVGNGTVVEEPADTAKLRVQFDGNGGAEITQTIDIYNPYSMLSFEAKIDKASCDAYGLRVDILDGDEWLGGAFYDVDTSGSFEKYWIPLDGFTGKTKTLRFSVYSSGGGSETDVTTAFIDNVQVGSGPYLTLTSVTEKGSGTATLPVTKFEYDENVLKYVKYQKDDSTWYNAVTYNSSKGKDDGRYYTKLTSKTINNGFASTSDFYTNNTYSYDYTDGESSFYDYVNGEYVGYEIVTVEDPAGNETKTYYYQDGGRRGLVAKVENYDNANHCYSKAVNTWAGYYENKVDNHSFESGSDDNFSIWREHDGENSAVIVGTMFHGEGDQSANVYTTEYTSDDPYISQTLDLSCYPGYPNRPELKLKFYMWTQKASGGSGYIDIYVGDSSVAKETIWGTDMPDGFSEGKLYELDITSEAGKSSVMIKFLVVSYDNSNGMFGFFLDDVKVVPDDMSFFSHISSTKEYTYDSDDTDYMIKKTDFEYDDYGNLKKTTAYKGTDTEGSFTVHSYSYADAVYDTDEYIFRTAHTKTTDAGTTPNTISESWNYYDGSYDGSTYSGGDGEYHEGNVTDTYPGYLTKGRLTKTESRLAGARDTAGNPKGYIQYDGYGNAVKAWDANGNMTETVYDTKYATFPVKTILPEVDAGNFCSYNYYDSYDYTETDIDTISNNITIGRLYMARDANGYIASSAYDSFGRITKTWDSSDTDNVSSSKPLSVIMYRGDGISDTDEFGNSVPDSISIPQNTITAAREDAYETSPSYLKTYTYVDGLGRTIQTKSPSKSPCGETSTPWIETNTVYNSRGMVDYTTTSKEVASYELNESITTEKTSYEYDCLGRATKVIEPNDKFVQTVYDDWTVTVYDEFTTETFTLSNPPTEDDKRYTKTYYDAFGRVVQVDQKNNIDEGVAGDYTYTGTVAYHMHKRINDTGDYYPSVVESTDAKGNKSWAASDYLGRSVKTADPDKGTWNYYYDSYDGYTSTGNLIAQQDAKGQTVSMTYDALNRISYKETSVYDGNKRIANYTYDTGTNGKGRLAKVNDGSKCWTNYYYDARGRTIKEEKMIDDEEFVTDWTYDSMDRVDTITYPHDGSTREVVKHTYGSGGSLEKLGTTSDTDKYVDYICYDEFGRMRGLWYGNDAKNYYYYNDASGNYRLSISWSADAEDDCMFFNDYSYDSVGNIKGINAYVDQQDDQSFTYDYLNRLTAQTDPDFAGGTTSYTYDSIDRVLTKTGITGTYAYTDSNHIHAATSAGGTSYTYDANGNMITKGSDTFSFNANNLLVKTVVDGTTEQYDYDHAGNRRMKGEFYKVGDVNGDGSVTTAGLSPLFNRDIRGHNGDVNGDGSVTTADLSPLFNKDFHGSPSLKTGTFYVSPLYEEEWEDRKVNGGTGTRTHKIKYYYANGQKIAKMDIDENDNGTLTFYHTDHLGSSSRITDADGSEVKKIGYMPYGDDAYDEGCIDQQQTSWGGVSYRDTWWQSFTPEKSNLAKVEFYFRTLYTGSTIRHIEIREGASDGPLKGVSRNITVYSHDPYNGTANDYVWHAFVFDNDLELKTDGTKYYIVVIKVSGNDSNVRVGGYTYPGGEGNFGWDYCFKTYYIDPKYKFTGKEKDTTGLYYYGARYYDPVLARFISPDAMGDNYVYCNNNPVMYVDPTGNFSWAALGAGLTTVGETWNYANNYANANPEGAERWNEISGQNKPGYEGITIGAEHANTVSDIGVSLMVSGGLSAGGKWIIGGLSTRLGTAGGWAGRRAQEGLTVADKFSDWTARYAGIDSAISPGGYDLKRHAINYAGFEAFAFFAGIPITASAEYAKGLAGVNRFAGMPGSPFHRVITAGITVPTNIVAGNLYGAIMPWSVYAQTGNWIGYSSDPFWDSRGSWVYANVAIGILMAASPAKGLMSTPHLRGLTSISLFQSQSQGFDFNQIPGNSWMMENIFYPIREETEGAWDWAKQQI